MVYVNHHKIMDVSNTGGNMQDDSFSHNEAHPVQGSSWYEIVFPDSILFHIENIFHE